MPTFINLMAEAMIQDKTRSMGIDVHIHQPLRAGNLFAGQKRRQKFGIGNANIRGIRPNPN